MPDQRSPLGTPSPEGNPILKPIYKPGTGTLFASVLEAHGTQRGNQVLMPTAPWSRMRLRIRMEGEAGFIGLAFADSKGNPLVRVRAFQDLTFTGAPEDGDEFTLNGNVWQMIEGGDPTSFGQFDFQIPVNDLDGALNNIVAAVNSDDAGVDVIFSTNNRPDVSFTAERISDTVIRFTAVRGGRVGNTFDTTENIANASFGGALATGGVASDIEADGQVIQEGQDITIDIPNHNAEAWLIVDVGGIDQRANDVVVFEIAGDTNSVPLGVGGTVGANFGFPREFPVTRGPVIAGGINILGNFAGISGGGFGTSTAIQSRRVFKFIITNNGPDTVVSLEEAAGGGRHIFEGPIPTGGVINVDFGPFGCRLANGQGVDMAVTGAGNSVFCTCTEHSIEGGADGPAGGTLV